MFVLWLDWIFVVVIPFAMILTVPFCFFQTFTMFLKYSGFVYWIARYCRLQDCDVLWVIVTLIVDLMILPVAVVVD